MMNTRKIELTDLPPEAKLKLIELGLALQSSMSEDFISITFPTLHESIESFRVDVQVAEKGSG